MMQLKVTLKRSTIGCRQDQIGTVRALGLKKIGQSVVKEANDSIKGQIFKIKHLVEVEEI
ncbi:MAG: 50S ribosomal protein L30 [Clostridia bacterium]|nr:50S ribosomal protein L30 [Clostridia bacterium]